MKSPRADSLEQHAQTIRATSGTEGLRPKAPTATQATHGAFWTVKELAQYLRISQRWIHERTGMAQNAQGDRRTSDPALRPPPHVREPADHSRKEPALRRTPDGTLQRWIHP